jgi:hypothetical protein
VFAKQANFAQGHQQVNNAARLAGERVSPEEISASTPNELLEGRFERLDGTTAHAPGVRDPGMAAMETRHGTAHPGRQGALVAKRLPRGAASGDARDD